MGVRGMSLRERRELLAGVLAAFDGLDGRLWEAGGAELAELLGEVDAVVRAGEAARVAVVAEAVQRGEPGAGRLAQSPVDWVLEHAPSLRAGGAAQVVRLAQAFRVPGGAPVKEAVVSGRLPVRAAAVVVSEVDRLRPLPAPGAEPAVLEGLITMAREHGPSGCRSLRPALLARYGLDGLLDRDQEVARRFVCLSQPRVGELELAEYRLVLDPEGRAVLEAALGPLSAPVPVDGGPDLRPADQRRGEALVTLVRRAVAAAESVPTSAKAQLFVMVDLDTLTTRLRAWCRRRRRGRGRRHRRTPPGRSRPGSWAVAPRAGCCSRRRWCAASRATRRSSRRCWDPRARWSTWAGPCGCSPRVSSGGCGCATPGAPSPGCTMPAHWCDGHHLVHWADGGASVLVNAALLCERHHTVVHQRRLAGTVTAAGVLWDLAYGSYDRALAVLAAREPA